MNKLPKQQEFSGLENLNVKPVVKWAGGKSRLKHLLVNIVELTLGRTDRKQLNYYEPFFGGGALFFELHNKNLIKKGYINDTIPHLVSFYKTISNEKWLSQFSNEVNFLVQKFNNTNSKEERKILYGEVSKNNGWIKEFNDLWVGKTPKSKDEKIKSAALFFVINKTGFNGMFRLNSKGQFNIPIGDKKSIEYDEQLFKSVSSILNKSIISNCSYEEILPPYKTIKKEKSFIYLDPPYIPNSKTENFTDYSKEGFKEKDHQNVADIFHSLSNDGFNIVLSNNLNEESIKKYSSNPNVFSYKVSVTRHISRTITDSKGKITRPPVEELLVSSFNLDSLGLEKI